MYFLNLKVKGLKQQVFILEDCHGGVGELLGVCLIHKDLLVVRIGIAAAQQVLIDLKHLMEECCSVLQNRQQSRQTEVCHFRHHRVDMDLKWAAQDEAVRTY